MDKIDLNKTINISGYTHDSIVDGPGLRYTLFLQGCIHNCIGCHNPTTHEISLGEDVKLKNIYDDIRENTLLDGVTISGGEPMLQIDSLIHLLRRLSKDGYSIIIYTGYTLEDLLKINDEIMLEAILLSDFLVDGPFVEDLKDLTLKFRGSSNQRIINIKDLVESDTIFT